jgi:serine/threonine protein kinase
MKSKKKNGKKKISIFLHKDYISKNERLSEKQARYFFKQIVTAVHYSHKNGICHRDIKIENLLLDSSFCIKLAGSSNQLTFSTHKV